MSIDVDANIAVPVSTELREQLGRVGVLLGGRSAEREISLKSGQAVLDGLLRANVDAIGLDLNENVIAQLTQANFDRVFIVLHGPGGEDGKVQALLSYLQLPFTGSDMSSSALAMDKLRCKQLWKGMGLPTPNFVQLNETSNWQQVLQQLGGEVIVKPAHEGSSLGMAKAKTPEALEEAFQAAFALDPCVIAEKVIQGAEYTVTILDGRPLPVIELETDNNFYDFNAKYVSEDTRYICPSRLTMEREKEVQELAVAAFRSLGCKGWGRVDFMADKDGNFYLLEVNTVPGMTDHSLVPMAAKAAGIGFDELVVRILLATMHNNCNQ